jgi:hypothetical protein
MSKRTVVRFAIDCLIQMSALFVMLTALNCWPMSGKHWWRYIVGCFAMAVYCSVERAQERRKWKSQTKGATPHE